MVAENRGLHTWAYSKDSQNLILSCHHYVFKEKGYGSINKTSSAYKKKSVYEPPSVNDSTL